MKNKIHFLLIIIILWASYYPACDSDTSETGPVCRNLVIEGEEECDVYKFGGKNCKSFGFDTGILKCTIDCKINTDLCNNFVCGDGIINEKYTEDGPIIEECDIVFPYGLSSCQDYGFYEGELECTDDCKISFENCSKKCGDGLINHHSESCDLDNFGGKYCVTGSMNCSETCEIETENCFYGMKGVDAGWEIGCAVKTNGTIHCWGSDECGKLGNGYWSVGLKIRPIKVEFYSANMIQVSTGTDHVCALSSDGRIWCWGLNTRKQVNDSDTSNYDAPEELTCFNKNVVQITTGHDHTCAILEDQTAWCWGNYQYGALGSGYCNFPITSAKVQDMGKITQISAGMNFTCAVNSNHEVYCWGYNKYGNLGLGEEVSTEQSVCGAEKVINLENVVQVSAGKYTTCALKSNGNVWCWGKNFYGQLGIDPETLDFSSEPVKIEELYSIVEVSVGGNHACAVRDDGHAFCWGSSFYGTLGNGIGMNETDQYNNPIPQQVLYLNSVEHISAGPTTTCASQSDGSTWCWGQHDVGQLGDGSPTGWISAYKAFPSRTYPSN